MSLLYRNGRGGTFDALTKHNDRSQKETQEHHCRLYSHNDSMLRMCSFCGDYGNKHIINEYSTFYLFMENKGKRQQETARLKFPKPFTLQLCIVLSAVSDFLQNSPPPRVAVQSRAKFSGLNISLLPLRGAYPPLLHALWEMS